MAENTIVKGRNLYRFALYTFIVYKAICIVAFGFRYTDSDQTVMWQAAMDMSRGEFHSLFWYGQTYSSNLESLLAVPLLWLKVPVYMALPIVSGLLALLPIVLFADIAARNGRYTGAMLVLLLSVTFPVEHWQTTMLSRGFIQGVACVSLGIYILHRTRMSIMFSLSGLLIAGGFWQNPNVIFLLCITPLMVNRFRPLSRISIALSGAVAATLMWFALRALAIRHMEYVVHPEPSTKWSLQQLINQLGEVPTLLSHTFYGGLTGVIILLIFIYILPKNKYLYASILFLLMLFMAVLGLNKSADFSDNIFFGPGRFFIALPYALLFMVSTVDNFEMELPFTYKVIFILLLFGSQALIFVNKCNTQYMCRAYAPVFVEKIDELKKNCLEIKKTAKENKTHFVLMGDHYMLESVTCGCAGFDDDFPVAIRPKYERRGWLWAKYNKQIPGKVLFLDSHLPEDSIQKSFSFEKVNVRGNGYVLNTGNLSNKEIMQRLFPAEHFH
ncbi:MAG: hypothetical protein EBV15_08365 [Bacteroidetes bacterium]|nr:hypothetical protein [Bacteroidota bacterium]